MTSVSGPAHVRTVFHRCGPRCVFRTTTCGRIPVVRSGISRSVRMGMTNAHVLTSFTMGCNTRGFIVVSASGTMGPAGIVKYSGHVYRVCIRSLTGGLRRGKRKAMRFVAAHFKGMLNSGNSMVPHFHSRVRHKNPMAIARPRVVHCFVAVPRTYELMLRTKDVKGNNRVCVFSVNGPIGVISLTGHVVDLSKHASMGVRFAKLQRKRGLCRRLLGIGRLAGPACRSGVVVTAIHRCSCSRIGRHVRGLVRVDCACSRVGVMTTVGSVIPRFMDGGSYFRTLSGGSW